MLSSQRLGRNLAASAIWGLAAIYLGLAAQPAAAQSFRVQCPGSTPLHATDTSDPYVGPVLKTGALTASNGKPVNYLDNGGGIKCQQISGGDGFATMGDGTQTYLFGFGPLSGLADQVAGLPGTEPAHIFNQSNLAHLPDIAGRRADRHWLHLQRGHRPGAGCRGQQRQRYGQCPARWARRPAPHHGCRRHERRNACAA